MKCEVHPSRVTCKITPLRFLYSREMLSNELDADREENVHSSAEVHVEVVESFAVRKRLDLWKVPEEVPTMQTFLLHIPHCLSKSFATRTCSKRQEMFQRTSGVETRGETEYVRRWIAA